MDKLFKAGIGLGVLLMGVAFLYYFVFYVPARNEQSQRDKEAEQANIEQTRSKLMNCIDVMNQKVSNAWENECFSRDLGSDCSLPPAAYRRLDTYKQSLKNDCYRLFPVK